VTTKPVLHNLAGQYTTHTDLIAKLCEWTCGYVEVLIRGGRAVHGASDVSDSQACNQCLCREVGSIPARGTRYVAPYRRDFRRGSCTGGFRVLRFPPPSKGSYSPNVLGRRDTVAAGLSPGRVARISQGNL
jgi:hypothetical protein